MHVCIRGKHAQHSSPWTVLLPQPLRKHQKVKHNYDCVPHIGLTVEVIEASISLPALSQILITQSWDPSRHSSLSLSMLVQSHFSQPIIKDKVILSLPRRGTQIEISSVHPICLVSWKAAPCIFFSLMCPHLSPSASKQNCLFGGRAKIL